MRKVWRVARYVLWFLFCGAVGFLIVRGLYALGVL